MSSSIVKLNTNNIRIPPLMLSKGLLIRNRKDEGKIIFTKNNIYNVYFYWLKIEIVNKRLKTLFLSLE